MILSPSRHYRIDFCTAHTFYRSRVFSKLSIDPKTSTFLTIPLHYSGFGSMNTDSVFQKGAIKSIESTAVRVRSVLEKYTISFDQSMVQTQEQII